MCVVTSKRAPLKMDPSLSLPDDVTLTDICGAQIVVSSYTSRASVCVYVCVCVCVWSCIYNSKVSCHVRAVLHTQDDKRQTHTHTHTHTHTGTDYEECVCVFVSILN